MAVDARQGGGDLTEPLTADVERGQAAYDPEVPHPRPPPPPYGAQAAAGGGTANGTVAPAPASGSSAVVSGVNDMSQVRCCLLAGECVFC